MYRFSTLLLSLVFVLSTRTAIFAQLRPSRISGPIRESRRTLMRGNMHPMARPEFDHGAAPDNLPLDRMFLVLKRSPEQDEALKKLLAGQQDRSSSDYHRWLTPDEFGRRFGPADQDVSAITSWLQSQGFIVSKVAFGRNVIEFSGRASQVESAFHTSIHRYRVNGADHWANSADPQIPSALSGVVAGIATMHTFGPKPLHVFPDRPIPFGAPAGFLAPNMNDSSNGSHALSPADFKRIYDLDTLSTSGNGVTIAVVARSNIHVEDIDDFRTLFRLPANSPQIIVNGPDPGILDRSEEAEAVLDTSWSGAVAPDASVKVVVSKSTNASDGVLLSEQYIIDNNLADVMTESFGTCEAHATRAFANLVESLAQQAAAQGITYLVSSGDSGSAGCDAPTSASATGPLSVNLLASSPYTTAVGGTQFAENGNDAQYWSPQTSSTGLSALSHIPEVAWNESCPASQCGTNASLWSGGGGRSIFFSNPDWQSGVPGIPGDGARYIPDLSLTSATHDPYLICLERSCVPDANGRLSLYGIGGTSAAAPAFAGVMAMVDQAALGRQGQANPVLYTLAGQQAASCGISNGATQPAPCAFHDVTEGGNAVPGQAGYGSPGATYLSSAGYDLATGLGSVHGAYLLQSWNALRTGSVTSSLSSSPVIFAPQDVGVLSPSQTFTVQNTGGMPVAIISITVDGVNSSDFMVTNTCSPSIPAHGSCSVSVTFTPIAAGPRSATVLLNGMSLGKISGTAIGFGAFEIINKLSGKVLDVKDFSTGNAAAIQQYVYLGGANQKWRFVPVDDGTWYEIVNELSGKVLDVTGYSTSNATQIQQWEYLGGDNQKWRIDKIDGVNFTIVNKLSGKALDVRDFSTANGAVVQQWDYLGGDNQNWQLAPVAYYAIQNKLSGKVLDVTNFSMENFSLIQQYDYLGGGNQKWQLVPLEENCYKIVNQLSGKVLDNSASSLDNLSLVQQFDFLNSDSQKWQVVPVDNTYFEIVNKLSGKVLDVRDYSLLNGAPIQQFAYLGGENQKWRFIPVQ